MWTGVRRAGTVWRAVWRAQSVWRAGAGATAGRALPIDSEDQPPLPKDQQPPLPQDDMHDSILLIIPECKQYRVWGLLLNRHGDCYLIGMGTVT